MKLLESIINDLVVTNVSLSDPLLKTKVLATRIRNAQLLKWVEGELSGYEEKADLPLYRKSKGIVKGNFLNGNKQYTNVDVPVGHLDNEILEKLIAIYDRDSVSSIEKLIGQKGVKMSLNSYVKPYLEDSIRELGNWYFELTSVYLEIPATFLSNILSSVRSKLLEFMLSLEQEFGVEADITILSKNNQTITHIMNTTINNSGDGAVINNGDNNNIEANITVNQGNKDALKTKLIEEKVTVNDAEELIKIIDKSTPVSKDNFGEPVNNWVQTMIGKALNGSWQVAIGAAGNILAQAIQAYYGLK